MNIFWLDSEPRTCAEYHNDKHCVKMILEYAQLLSTAHRVLDGKPVSVTNTKTGKPRKHLQLSDPRADVLLYKPTHVNHPCAVWARESQENYYTLYNLFTELLYEYNVRYGRKHKTADLSLALSQAPINLTKYGRTDIPLCMPDQYKVPSDPVQSYRNYYRQGKSHIAQWRFRKTPEWYS